MLIIFNFCFQVLEHATPEELLQNEGSAFSRMVQSTGPANAQYLRSLVFEAKEKLNGEVINRLNHQRRWVASSRWAAAAQFALAVSLSQNDLQSLVSAEENNILNKTKDAVITLQQVLEGKHNEEIDDTLQQYQVPRERWWLSLHRIIEGKHSMQIHVNKHVHIRYILFLFDCFMSPGSYFCYLLHHSTMERHIS